MESNNLQQKGLKVVLLSQLLMEAMDDVKGTDMYKGNLKKFGNTFCNLLNAVVKQNDAVYKEHPTMATNLYNELDGLVEKLATQDIHGLVMIKQIHDVYSKNPADWDSCFNLELTELDQ